jgi:hypothetical protein
MEQQPIQADIADQEQQRFKTLGVRIDEDLHAQLTFIAQLRGNTVTDEIKHSIAARVHAAQDDPELLARAEEVRAEIEREAEARKQAIAGLFGKLAIGGEGSAPAARATKRTGRSSSADGGAA